MNTTPADAIRDLAAKANEDALMERRAAADALIRAECFEDKALELNALAGRIEEGTYDAGDREGVLYFVRPV